MKKKHHSHVHKKHHHKKVKKWPNINYIIVTLLGIIAVIAVFNISKLSSMMKHVDEVDNGFPNIELLVIRDASCTKCYGLIREIETIKAMDVDVEEKIVDFNSREARNLIDKYDIKKIPIILISGEIEGLEVPNFERRDDVLVLARILSPYINTANGEVKGVVELVHITKSNCEKCVDLNPVIRQFKQTGMVFSKETVLDDTQAADLIARYDIKKLPILIFSEGASEYDTIKQSWQQLGTVEEDGSYILRGINPPYYSLEDNTIKGLVKLTMLVDESCTECYEVRLHKPILERFSITIDTEETVDVSSEQGKRIIEKYDIKKVPTIILSDEANAYPILKPVWKQVGTIEEDGAYIFRNVEVMKGKYVDLETKEIKG